VLLAVWSSGCLDLSGHQAVVMSLNLAWDEDTQTSDFQSGTCNSAGVKSMTWSLTRSDTKEEVASNTEPCANGIDVIDPSPAEYTLKVTGTDSNGDTLWHSTCKGLRVLRFDVSYDCDVDAP
jgi:hypothetical protein